MKNKIYIGLGIILFGVVTSYIAFSWTEPTLMPSDYAVPINTSHKEQSVDVNKPVIENLDADKLDGLHANEIMAATTAATGTSTLNIVVAQFAKNNPGLGFPACPEGFVPILHDGFVQYQNQENVVGAYYDGTTCTYTTRASLNGVDMPLFFQVYKNTQNAVCHRAGAQHSVSSSPFSIPVTCVGDCSNCSDAASVSLTYSVCARDPLSGTFQGGTISEPVVTSLNVERLISDIPYKGKVQITANINNGGENVTAKLYINGTLTETKTVTSSYSYLHEAPENQDHDYKLEVSNSKGSDEKTTSVWIGAIGGGMHTIADCETAGGEVVEIQPGQRVCRFTMAAPLPYNQEACPAGWTGYYNWSTTGCSSVFGHSWANIPAGCGMHSGDVYECQCFTQRGCY